MVVRVVQELLRSSTLRIAINAPTTALHPAVRHPRKPANAALVPCMATRNTGGCGSDLETRNRFQKFGDTILGSPIGRLSCQCPASEALLDTEPGLARCEPCAKLGLLCPEAGANASSAQVTRLRARNLKNKLP